MSQTVWCVSECEGEGFDSPTALFTSRRAAELYLCGLLAADIDEAIRCSPGFCYNGIEDEDLLAEFDFGADGSYALRKSRRERIGVLEKIYFAVFPGSDFVPDIREIELDEHCKGEPDDEPSSSEEEEKEEEEDKEESGVQASKKRSADSTGSPVQKMSRRGNRSKSRSPSPFSFC